MGRLAKIAGTAAVMAFLAGNALAQDDAAGAAAPETEAGTETASEGTAPADIPNNTAFGDWILSCDAVTTSRTSCRLVQEQSLRESGQLVARFIAVPVSDGAILLAQVPMGVYLPGGAVYRFEGDDAQEQREMIWQRCAGEVCEAAAPLDEEELALFAEVEALLFGFRMAPEAEPIVLRVDISEFAEAMDAIRDTTG
ncbi:invasion associated locus B family protein [Roseitranquillus sediminis]|uniref:invasion associated locus B family protein n=1 Tax=Roseitranquillus sediminis TaxID=2809051 RepID=UPI001D0C5FD0|nr:invasion associated locus B family protein [Roseitranquillus sediminis]MBM9595917.1 invasion associated locus B family protein [Roseitranquillus sediminis]